MPCFIAARWLAIASAPHGGNGPVYPGLCRDGPTHPGRPEAIRMRMPEPPPSFVDLLAGPSAPGLGRGDFVVHRKDGAFAYQLACVVDDHDERITEVVRGDDLIPSTPRQIAIYQALGWEVPAFLHLPLVLGPDGERLAKRHGAISLAELRERGWSAERVNGLLAHGAGLTADPSPIEAAALVGHFTLGALRPAPVRIDPA